MKSKFFKGAMFVLFLGLWACGGAPTEAEGQTVKVLSAAEFKAQIGSGAQVVDVRTPSECAGGVITTAKNIDVKEDDFRAKAKAQLDPNKPVMVYCQAGARSSRAAKILAEEGFKVLDLDGGMSAWKGQNFPVVKLGN